MEPLRIAVHAEPPLTDAERRTLAALLLRTRVPMEISGAKSAQISLTIDEQCDKAITISREELRTVESLLSGENENSAARDEHGRPLPPPGELPPVVDQMGWELRNKIIAKFPVYGMKETGWRFCLTFDLDSAGMFHGTNAWHTFRQLPKEPAKYLEFLRSGFSTALGTTPDPHLPFDFLLKLLKLQDIRATFFVQTHRRHKLDSYDLAKAGMLRDAIGGALKDGHAVGLHSSYSTRDSEPDFFKQQWDRLREVFGGDISNVHRAHYLRAPEDMKAYETRNDLIDSSLMYSQQPGFRRGTSFPFRMTDRIVEMPPSVMDTTLRYQRKLNPEQAQAEAWNVMAEAKKYGGVFTIIWHPHNLNNLTWQGWAKVLFSLIGDAKRQGAQFQTLADAARDLQDRADEIEYALAANPS